MSDGENGRHNPLKLDFSSNSNCMVISFGSLRLNSEVPPFEWLIVLDQIPAKKIYTRELNQIWFLNGLPGIANSPQGICEHLRYLINQEGCERVVTVGSSMGGYAALLFGYLLQADAAIAIAPQTFLPTRRIHMLGRPVLRKKWRILWRYWQLISNRQVDRQFFDLKPLLNENHSQTRYSIYYSSENRKDEIQALHLADLPNVAIHDRRGGGHLVIHTMRDSGELEKVLLDAIKISSNVEVYDDR